MTSWPGQPKAPPMRVRTKTVWLIELLDDNGKGLDLCFGVNANPDPKDGSHWVIWVQNPDKAMQFARKQDAELAAIGMCPNSKTKPVSSVIAK